MEPKSLPRTLIAVGVSALLAGCVGGGGGGSSATLSPFVARDVPFYAPVRINSFQPHHQPYEYRTPLTEIHTRDLNGDGADEVLWSNVAFDWTGTNWINSQVQIFGSNTGSFQNETTSWFRAGDNVYTGGFKINFGDFNKSGFTDVFLATFTDTPNHTGPSILLENTVTTVGGVSPFTRRVIDFGVNLHSHDSVVADFDGDGIDDVFKTGSGLMLGSSIGVYTILTTNTAIGSGLSAADYLGDGTITVVMSDGPGIGDQDTVLLRPRIDIDNRELFMDQIALLPADRFFLPKWDDVRASTTLSPHAVRNIAMDFNGDGRPDVVVFSTMPKDGNVHGWTEVQFLRNDGGGVFTDVTDSLLINFDHGKTVTYNPQLIDVNNDGLLDIFMSTTDYTGQSSTSVLLATKEGRFVESYVQVFDAFSQQIRDIFGNRAGNNQPIAIVAGLNNTRYLVSGVEYDDGGVAKIAVYASLIGSTGTITPEATVDAVRQVWPWMTDAQINQALASSSIQYLNGIPVIDLARAMMPNGGLGISLDGRGGVRQTISGHISVPGLDANMLSGVAAVDILGRDFQIDLRSMQRPLALPDIKLYTSSPDRSWSSGFVALDVNRYQGVMAHNDDKNWTIGFDTSALFHERSWNFSITATQIQGSPWLGFSGVFGRIERSTILEFNLSKSWHNGIWAQAAMMQTSTAFSPGLVTGITPIYSTHSVLGWTQKGFTIYGGIQPYIVSGDINLRLPRNVDDSGVMQYSDHRVNLQNDLTRYAGFHYNYSDKMQGFSVNAVINSERHTGVFTRYRRVF
jgi:hypothetical protein